MRKLGKKTVSKKRLFGRASLASLSLMSMTSVATSRAHALDVGKLLCDGIEKVNGQIPGLTIEGPCKPNTVKNLYYHGAQPVDQGLRTDLFSLPALTTGALFCGVGGATQEQATGTADTAVGRFGLSSHVRITDKDVSKQHVSGQRVGTVYLFGAGADLDVQNFELAFASEARPAGTVQARSSDNTPYTQEVVSEQAYYMTLTSEGAPWRVSGTASIPLPLPGVTGSAHVEFSSNSGRFEGLNNNLFEFSGEQDNAPNMLFSYTTARPMWWERLQHDRVRPASYYAFNDGLIPYDHDKGGADAYFLYADNQLNWFHFGMPGVASSDSGQRDTDPNRLWLRPESLRVPGELGSVRPERAWDLTPNDSGLSGATQNFTLDVGASYDLGVVELGVAIKTNASFRSGLAIRQGERVVGSIPTATEFPMDDLATAVTTELYSQSSVGVAAEVRVETLLGDWKETRDILTAHPTQHPHAVLSEIVYDKPNSDQADGPFLSSVVSWTTGGQTASDPTDAYAQCLKGAPQTNPPVPVASVSEFITKAAQGAVEQVHPCRVNLCLRLDPNGSAVDAHFRWDDAQKKLVLDHTAGRCPEPGGTYEEQIDLCNQQGESVLPNGPITRAEVIPG